MTRVSTIAKHVYEFLKWDGANKPRSLSQYLKKHCGFKAVTSRELNEALIIAIYDPHLIGLPKLHTPTISFIEPKDLEAPITLQPVPIPIIPSKDILSNITPTVQTKIDYSEDISYSLSKHMESLVVPVSQKNDKMAEARAFFGHIDLFLSMPVTARIVRDPLPEEPVYVPPLTISHNFERTMYLEPVAKPDYLKDLTMYGIERNPGPIIIPPEVIVQTLLMLMIFFSALMSLYMHYTSNISFQRIQQLLMRNSQDEVDDFLVRHIDGR